MVKRARRLTSVKTVVADWMVLPWTHSHIISQSCLLPPHLRIEERLTWLGKVLEDKNVNPQKPTKKSTPDIVNSVGGIYLNQSCKNQESKLREGRRYSGDWCTRTPSKLFVADAMLSTSEANQQKLTIVEETVRSADW